MIPASTYRLKLTNISCQIIDSVMGSIMRSIDDFNMREKESCTEVIDIDASIVFKVYDQFVYNNDAMEIIASISIESYENGYSVTLDLTRLDNPIRSSECTNSFIILTGDFDHYVVSYLRNVRDVTSVTRTHVFNQFSVQYENLVKKISERIDKAIRDHYPMLIEEVNNAL